MLTDERGSNFDRSYSLSKRKSVLKVYLQSLASFYSFSYYRNWLFFFWGRMGTELKALHMLGRSLTTDGHLDLFLHFFIGILLHWQNPMIHQQP